MPSQLIRVRDRSYVAYQLADRLSYELFTSGKRRFGSFRVCPRGKYVAHGMNPLWGPADFESIYAQLTA